jgi:hypothetical protein
MSKQREAEPEQKPVYQISLTNGPAKAAWIDVDEATYYSAKMDATYMARCLYAAPPARKPVAWMYHGILHNGTLHDRPSFILRPEYMDAMSAGKGAKATPLYTSPPQRKPLTEPELNAIEPTWPCDWKYEEVLAFARAIERAHGIGDE